MGFWSDLLGTVGTAFGIGRGAGRVVLSASGLTGERTFTFPDESGELSTGGGGGGGPALGTPTTLNIASGEITVTGHYHLVEDTNFDGTLHTINGGNEGDILVLHFTPMTLEVQNWSNIRIRNMSAIYVYGADKVAQFIKHSGVWWHMSDVDFSSV